MWKIKPSSTLKRLNRALAGFPRFKSRPAEPAAKMTDDLWVQRLSTGLYRIGVTKKVSDKLGGVGFVDICDEGSILCAGKPFGMVEGPSGTHTVSAVLSGEVVECNEALKKSPEVLAQNPEDMDHGWLIEVDSACDYEDEEVEWKSLEEAGEPIVEVKGKE
ncbi:hypothetical protein AAMO2058_000600000 [Amorphochlora amoebiformis]